MWQERTHGNAEPFQSLACADSPGREFGAAFRDCTSNTGSLFGVKLAVQGCGHRLRGYDEAVEQSANRQKGAAHAAPAFELVAARSRGFKSPTVAPDGTDEAFCDQ